MKMRNLLFGVILGLLAVVRSTPVQFVTQMPDKAEVLKEAVKDKFLVSTPHNATVPASQQTPFDSEEGSGQQESSDVVLPGGTISSSSITPNIYTITTSEPTMVTPESKSSDIVNDDHHMLHESTSHSSITPNIETTTSEPTTVTTESKSSHIVNDDHHILHESTSHSSMNPDIKIETTPEPPASTTPETKVFPSESSSSPTVDMLDADSFKFSITSDKEATPETTTVPPESTSAHIVYDDWVMLYGETTPQTTPVHSESKDSHGLHDNTEDDDNESSTKAQTSTASSASKAAPTSDKESRMFGEIEGSGVSEPNEFVAVKQSFNVQQSHQGLNVYPSQEPGKGHSTPGWVIIVGFIAGVAALVMLCVAIATRDKWNRASRPSQVENGTSSSNQQRVEMETFLNRDTPRENGKAGEYTVIPLDELPEKYSSH